MVFQLNAMVSPYNDDHFRLNAYYTLNSIVCLVLQVLSFRHEKNMKLILVNSTLFVIRMGIRLYDFENSQEKMYSAQWSLLIVNNIVGSLFAVTLKIFAVHMDIYQLVLFLLEASFLFICLIYGCNLLAKDDEEKPIFFDDLKNFILGLGFLIFFVYLLNKVNLKLFDETY